MKNLHLKEEPEQKPAVTPAEAEKTEKKKPAAETETPVVKSPVEENRSKSNIDLHIVGKIDLSTITKAPKPAKKEETKEEKEEKPVEKPKDTQKEKVKKTDIPEKEETKNC